LRSTAYHLHISPDHLQASLHSGTANPADLPLLPDHSLSALLTAHHIVHGLDPLAIDRAEAARSQNRLLDQPILLARGTPPKVGHRGLHPSHTPFYQYIEPDEGNEQAGPIELLLFPLVHAGDVLAEPGPPSHPETGKNIHGEEISCPFPPEQTVLAGDNTIVDETSGALLATATGYPSYGITRKGTSEQLRLGIKPLIRITADNMQALLSLKPAPPGETLPAQGQIEQVLDEQQIIYGRLPQAIHQCLQQCSQEQRPLTVPVALGVLPIKGRDAWLRFAMDIGPIPGKVMGNGEIDYRERNMFIGVNKDQVIAVRVPPTPGSPGRDIHGNTIAQAPGKDIAIRATDDAVYDQETNEIRALRSGVLSMVSEGAVKVCSRQVISQDIDFKTGNIVSRDALEIRGSVKPKFRVNALGDILIRGNIEKAQVRSDANVVVQTGMVGDHSVIRCRGDVDIQFVERGPIFAGGSILVRKSGYYCRLHTDGNLNSAPGSRILASQLVAAGSLVVDTIGSTNAEPSLLAAAVSPKQLQSMFTLRREVAAHRAALDDLRRRLGPEAESEELDELLDEYRQSRKTLEQLNLIGTDAAKASDQGLSLALECSILVKGTVFAGTKIRIGNSHMVLAMTMSNVKFGLSQHIVPETCNREIIVLPNKK
jgi:uncharacterized protein (DUF342 family)